MNVPSYINRDRVMHSKITKVFARFSCQEPASSQPLWELGVIGVLVGGPLSSSL